MNITGVGWCLAELQKTEGIEVTSQADLETMAKKETHEKRAKKAQKEEHIVLGGNTHAKKEGFKKRTDAPKGAPRGDKNYSSSGPRKFDSKPGGARTSERSAPGPSKYTITREGDEGERKPRTAGSRDSRPSADRPRRNDSDAFADRKPRTAARSGESKPPFDRSKKAEGNDWVRKPRSFDGAEKREPRSSSPDERRPRVRKTVEGSDAKPRYSDRSTGTGRSDRGPSAGERRGPSTGERRGPFKPGDKFKRDDKKPGPFGKSAGFKPRRDSGEDPGDRFPARRDSPRSFRDGDKKGSNSKFLKDQHFDGFEARGTGADELIRLNKYLSIAGICSRREADTYITDGLVTVNGVVVTELGTKVKPTDEVKYAGERIKAETLRYILVNKPKDCITTLSDEKGRSTVIGLVKNACRERVFPVGRLDRNTTGLILLTNDGDIAKKLSHPSHNVRKVYHVITDKNVTQGDLKKLESGVMLEDGMANADAALYAGDGSVKNELGLEIHSGKNRVVRRMFAALGYEVVRLDRAAFAGLSKKGLPRGRWRFLTEKEISYLRML